MKDNFPIHRLSHAQESFPHCLGSIRRPPKEIYWRGSLSFSAPCRIAIVGTRKASLFGLAQAKLFAQTLAARGCTIISGLALGIDAAAHQGALDGGGITWAVLAHGLDSIHPHHNERLAYSLLHSGGCLLSEYPPQTPAYADHFILRNRIISALSDAVIVIEAPARSGSLATAHYAQQQQKEVFVLPGPIHANQYKGSLGLLRAGCRLVRSPDDVIEDLSLPQNTQPLPLGKYPTGSAQDMIINAFHQQSEALSIDKLSQITTLSPQDIAIALTQLILDGLIVEEHDTYRVR